MTDLQLGLMALGGVLVAGVFAYNKWQERAHRKVAEQMLQRPSEDILMGQSSLDLQEPTMTSLPPTEMGLDYREPAMGIPREDHVDTAPVSQPPMFAEVPTDNVAETVASKPVFEEVNTVGAVPGVMTALAQDDFPIRPEQAPGPLPETLLSPKVDCIAALETVDFVPVIQLLHAQREMTAPISKPIHWAGYNEDSRQWEFFPTGGAGEYRRIRMALQLVNRRGPVTEDDLTLFGNAVQRLSDEFMAVADMPASQSLLETAKTLDAFCAEVDLQIGVNIVSKGSAFPGTKIRGLAEAAGMVLGSDGAFTRGDDDGRVLFSMVNFETMPFAAETLRTMSTHGLTFLLDVPRVSHGERNFNHMIDLARRFADALHGTLVDDNRHPLSDSQLEQIRKEYVGKPQAAMAAYGILPGSAMAQRLFA